MGAMLGVSRGYADGHLPTQSASTSADADASAEKQDHTEKSDISLKTNNKSKNETKAIKPNKSKSSNVLSVIEDIQRLPNEAIHQEFDRLLAHTGRHFKTRDERPCEDISEKLQNCLHQNQQNSSKCFNLMDEYSHCVYRATQEKLDMDSVEEIPPLMPIMPPVIMPKPQMPVQQQDRHRSWWKFWTWFR